MFLFRLNSRQDENERQIPGRIHGLPEIRAGKGVPHQSIHHDPPENRTGTVPVPVRAPGEDLVPESSRQGAETDEEAGRHSTRSPVPAHSGH